LKYHSTKKSVLTLSLIIILLLIISAIGIFRFQAETPVQAVSSTLIKNLEMPNGYSIEINNISESFLAKQKIAKIVIKKGEIEIISISNLIIDQNFFNYIGYFLFNKNLDLKISADYINININENIDDLFYSLSKIKIKDNTIAIQSKLDSKKDTEKVNNVNIEELINSIVKQKYIDLSLIIKPELLINSLKLNIKSGLLNYNLNKIKYNSKIENLFLDLESDSILKTFNFELTQVSLLYNNFKIENASTKINYENEKVTLNIQNSFNIFNDNNSFLADNILINYDLGKVGQVLLDINDIEYQDIRNFGEIKSLKAQVKTNLRDFSVVANPNSTSIQIDNNNLNFEKANIGMSIVNNKITFYYNSEGLTSLFINNNLININDLDLSLFSTENIINKSNIKIGSIEYKNNNIDTLLKNINLKANCETNSDYIFKDNKIDFKEITLDNLINSYNSVNLLFEANINYLSDNLKVNSSIISTIDIEENFKTISTTIKSDDLQIDDLANKIKTDLNIQGPISFEKNNIKALELNLNYDNQLILKTIGQINGDISNNHISTSILFQNFNLNEIGVYINKFIPSLNNYLSNNTKLNGALNYDGNIPTNKNISLKGKVDSSLLIKEAQFIDNNYDFGLNINTEIDDIIFNFNQISLSLFNYRFAFNGRYNINTKAIDGLLNLEDIEKAEKLLLVDFKNSDLNSTNFILTTPKLSDFSLDGLFVNKGNSIYSIISNINLKNDKIDFDISADIKNLIFSALSSKGLTLDLSIKDNINLNLKVKDFDLIDLDYSRFNGEINLSYHDKNDWDFNIFDFDFSYNNQKYDLILNGKVSQDSFYFDKINYFNNRLNTKYFGTLKYKGPQYTSLLSNKFKDKYQLDLTFGDNSTQRIEASMFNRDKITNLFFDVSKFNIARLFNTSSEILLDARIIGSTDFEKNNKIKGNIEFNEAGILNNIISSAITTAPVFSNDLTEDKSLINRVFSLIPFINLPTNAINNNIISTIPLDASKISFSTNLSIDDNNYSLEDLNLTFPKFSLKNSTLSFDSEKVDLLFNSKVELIKPSLITNQLSSFDIDFNINFLSLISTIKSQFSINEFTFNSINTVIERLKGYKDFDYSLLNNINGHLNLTNFDLFKDTIEFEKLWPDTEDDKVKLQDVYSTYNINDNSLKLVANYGRAKVDFKAKQGSLILDKDFGLGGNLIFDYNNSFDLYINDINLPVSFFEKIVYIKLIKFFGDDFTGSLIVKDLFNDAKLYGDVSTRSLKLKTLYTKDSVLEAPNLSVIFDDDKIYSNNFKVKYFDTETNSNIYCYSNAQVILDNFIFKNFSIDVICPNYIPVYMPLLGMNFTIDVKGKNYFSFSTDGITSYINGDLVVKDAVVRSGINLPSWIIPRQESNGDFKITTAENNSFYYPQLDNPILSATMDKNQNFELKFDSLSKTYSAQGSINILQGEIFYFQKNFYINDGNISLRVNPETKRLEPIISIEATLREIDLEGDNIDIVLNLNNASLDNLNPVFSSIPAKSQKEIMQILGQSFTSSSSTDSTSVATIASAATSVFSSLGYIETGGVSTLNKTIASALNLDFFSLKSNIVENLILDTFIEDPRYSSYSPLARYLNNTTVFMGKYLTPNSKLQIMINLLASNDDSKTSFISSDLSLDLEMSYEIDTELAKFSFFTNPTQLSILKILDTMGFSVTKTIHLR